MALHQHALQLSTAKDLNEIVTYTLDAMEFGLGFDFANVHFVEGDRLLSKETRGMIGYGEHDYELDGPGIMAKAVKSASTILVPDTEKEGSYLPPRGKSSREAPTMLSELVVPIIINKQAIGVLNVESARLNAFTAEDQRLLETLASHVASEFNRLKQTADVGKLLNALRISEDRYRTLLENLPVGVYRSTAEGILVEANQTFASILGYDNVTDMKQIDIHDLYVERSDRLSLLSRLGESGTETVELRLRRRDGRKIWVRDFTRAILKSNGRVAFYDGIITDITDRKKAEAELEQYSKHLQELVAERTSELAESENKYRSLVENIPDVTWTVDERSRIRFMSSNVAGVYGFTSQEICGAGKTLWAERIHPDDALHVREVLASLFLHGRFDVEYRIQRKDGKWIWLHDRAISTYERDGVRYADGVFSDITEQKDMERRLLKAERLAAIGETAAMVGHDLRNPLQAITAAVYVLKTELQPESEKSAEMFELVENAVLYSNKIVTNLLEYSGEMRLDLALTTPRAITEGALLLAKVPSNIVVRNLTEDQPILRVDEEKMQRAFLNLIENAFDAMPTGGELTISAKESKNYLEVKLSDTGIGMALDALTNIWKPLQTTKAKGIGLGLAICKRAIEAHGGTISVESFVGRGTTFTIIIPMRKEECRVEKIAQAI